MRNMTILTLFVAVAVVPASAGILPTDTNAMAGWTGTVHVAGPADYFEADLEYAVYEPGKFTDSFAGEAVAPELYVYAYQIANVTGVPSSFTPKVTALSVGFDDVYDGGNEDELPSVPSFVADAGKVAPSGSWLNPAQYPGTGLPSSARWDFQPAVYESEESSVLYYTSPYGPEWDYVAADGIGSAVGVVPSPAPEPASMVLLTSVGLAVLRRRRSS